MLITYIIFYEYTILTVNFISDANLNGYSRHDSFDRYSSFGRTPNAFDIMRRNDFINHLSDRDLDRINNNFDRRSTRNMWNGDHSSNGSSYAALSTILEQNDSQVSASDRLERYRVLDKFMKLTDSILDQKVQSHRSAATWYEATHTWSGVLPRRPLITLESNFATKVFLGGVPWEATDEHLCLTFSRFGRVQIEWPGKDRNAGHARGHLYLNYESQFNVKRLLSACATEMNNEGQQKWYFRFTSPNTRRKMIEVIPWVLCESVYSCNYFRPNNINQFDPTKTVFVGAIHGTLNAEGLAKILNDLFDGVLAVSMDTDRWKYPMGSARVTFSNSTSYNKAIKAAFVQIKTDRINKIIQLDPYLEETNCMNCGEFRGLYFCRDLTCFKYYCCICWRYFHSNKDDHKPIGKRFRQSP